jgi:hypothetical protein
MFSLYSTVIVKIMGKIYNYTQENIISFLEYV